MYHKGVSIPLFSGLHTDKPKPDWSREYIKSQSLCFQGCILTVADNEWVVIGSQSLCFQGCILTRAQVFTAADKIVSIPLFSGLHTDVLKLRAEFKAAWSQSLCFQGCILTLEVTQEEDEALSQSLCFQGCILTEQRLAHAVAMLKSQSLCFQGCILTHQFRQPRAR